MRNTFLKKLPVVNRPSKSHLLLSKNWKVLKTDKEILGDNIHAMLAAAAMHFERKMSKWKNDSSFLFFAAVILHRNN